VSIRGGRFVAVFRSSKALRVRRGYATARFLGSRAYTPQTTSRHFDRLLKR